MQMSHFQCPKRSEMREGGGGEGNELNYNKIETFIKLFLWTEDMFSKGILVVK